MYRDLSCKCKVMIFENQSAQMLNQYAPAAALLRAFLM
jgi:hypothetical protein